MFNSLKGKAYLLAKIEAKKVNVQNRHLQEYIVRGGGPQGYMPPAEACSPPPMLPIMR